MSKLENVDESIDEQTNDIPDDTDITEVPSFPDDTEVITEEK